MRLRFNRRERNYRSLSCPDRFGSRRPSGTQHSFSDSTMKEHLKKAVRSGPAVFVPSELK